MSDRRLICIAGGIGSGKSVVSRVLRLQGFEVYDCDREASRLMESDSSIREAIVRDVDHEAYDAEGRIRRKRLAANVFADKRLLLRLNAIVHAAVRMDVARRGRRKCSAGPLFIESAITAESGLAEMADEIWLVVTDSEEERIERVCRRSGLTRQETKARIEAQRHEYDLLRGYRVKIREIFNDAHHQLISQIRELVENMKEVN